MSNKKTKNAKQGLACIFFYCPLMSNKKTKNAKQGLASIFLAL